MCLVTAEHSFFQIGKTPHDYACARPETEANLIVRAALVSCKDLETANASCAEESAPIGGITSNKGTSEAGVSPDPR